MVYVICTLYLAGFILLVREDLKSNQPEDRMPE